MARGGGNRQRLRAAAQLAVQAFAEGMQCSGMSVMLGIQSGLTSPASLFRLWLVQCRRQIERSPLAWKQCHKTMLSWSFAAVRMSRPVAGTDVALNAAAVPHYNGVLTHLCSQGPLSRSAPKMCAQGVCSRAPWHAARQERTPAGTGAFAAVRVHAGTARGEQGYRTRFASVLILVHRW
jgi:hypothetical protein